MLTHYCDFWRIKQRDISLLIGYRYVYVNVYLFIEFHNYFIALELGLRLCGDHCSVCKHMVLNKGNKILHKNVYQLKGYKVTEYD